MGVWVCERGEAGVEWGGRVGVRAGGCKCV
jgi:hypothetical protein